MSRPLEICSACGGAHGVERVCRSSIAHFIDDRTFAAADRARADTREKRSLEIWLENHPPLPPEPA